MTKEPQALQEPQEEPKTYRTKEQQDAHESTMLSAFKATPALTSKASKTKRLNKKLPRVAILLDAAIIISQDRNTTHGEPEDSFANIAKLWSAYLNAPVTSEDVCHLMTLLKVGRTQSNPAYIEDNYIDAVGYEALAGELRKAAESKDSK